MPTLLDVESSYLNGNARVQEWREKFLTEWLRPIRETQLLLWWGSQSPEMHATMQMMQPDAYARVQEKVTQLEERRARNALR